MGAPIPCHGTTARRDRARCARGVARGRRRGRQDLPPYSLLLKEVLEGDPTLSIRGDEAEELWRIVEPVLSAWSDKRRAALGIPGGLRRPVRRTPCRVDRSWRATRRCDRRRPSLSGHRPSRCPVEVHGRASDLLADQRVSGPACDGWR